MAAYCEVCGTTFPRDSTLITCAPCAKRQDALHNAAPDLLAALEETLRFIAVEVGVIRPEIAARARAAIARARGTQEEK